MATRTLVFDAYGTLYDVQSVRALATELCGDKGELITCLWRLKQLEYTWLRTAMRAYEDFWSVTRSALEFALTSVGLVCTPALCERLMTGYLHLELYPEAQQALALLSHHKLAILSNGSPSMLEALVGSSAIGGRLSAVISVDQAKAYKPEPSCYALVESTLGVAKEDVLFISSNGFDVAGAKRYGFQVAWIERAGNTSPPQISSIGASGFFRLLRGGAEQLGCEPDFRLQRLTELVGVLSA